MNILQISRDSVKVAADSGGLESYIFNLSKNLVKIGNKVTIIGRRTEKEEIINSYDEGFQQINLDTCRISDNLIAKMPSFFAILCREFNQVSFSLRVTIYLRAIINNYDIIAVHLPVTGSIIA